MVHLEKTGMEYFVLKTDTDFTNTKYRILNPDPYYDFNLVQSTLANDSLYLIVRANSDDYTFSIDGFNASLFKNNVLLVLDSSLTARKVQVLNSDNQFSDPYNQIKINKILVSGGKMFFHLTFTGKNNSILSDYPADYSDVILFGGTSKQINLNGNTISYLVRCDLTLGMWKLIQLQTANCIY